MAVPQERIWSQYRNTGRGEPGEIVAHTFERKLIPKRFEISICLLS